MIELFLYLSTLIWGIKCLCRILELIDDSRRIDIFQLAKTFIMFGLSAYLLIIEVVK